MKIFLYFGPRHTISEYFQKYIMKIIIKFSIIIFIFYIETI